MIRQKLEQKLLQKLSPQQIQVIKLLEVPTMQLEQRIKKEIEENPALDEGEEEEPIPAEEEETDQEQDEEKEPGEEEKDGKDQDDEFSLEDYIEDEEIPSYKLSSGNYSVQEKKDIPFSVGSTFHENLERQIGLRSFSEKQQIISRYIIGNIDDDGYLRREGSSLIDDIAFAQNISVDENEITEVLEELQTFDPAGVGARTLQECLLLQIRRKQTPDKENQTLALAEKILLEHFIEFTRKHYDKIISRMTISKHSLKEAVDEILKLNPKPGSAFSDPHNKSFQPILPDFILENNDGELHLTINARNIPDLHISRKYADMLSGYENKRTEKTKKDREAISFVRQKIESARWFIDAIRQRQHTMMLTMNAILSFQQEYFLTGDETKLKPMILKDIASATELDISTISRVANSKYIHTPSGIFSLKYFFSEGLQTESGEEASSRKVKSILQDCIGNENKTKPLTDEKLVEILHSKGFVIARRTVAKYREQLNIPVARLRKEL